MLARLLTVFGLLVATLSSKAALAWEPVRWPSNVCDPIDQMAADGLVYEQDGLENWVRPSWLQCPIRTVPGLRPDEFVEWTAELYAPAGLPCLLRVVSEQGEVLATTSLSTPEPEPWFSPPSAMTFSWQPANAELYGVGETAAIVRCGLSISQPFESPGRTALTSVVAPGDGDTERHNWPGTMCKPMEDLDPSRTPKGTEGMLYNSGGAIANLSTRFERWVVCPVPVPARKGILKRVRWEGRVLNDAQKHWEIWGNNFSEGTGWGKSSPPQPGRVVIIDVPVNHALKDTINVLYWLAPNGPLGPAGIASYVTELEYELDPPAEQ